MDNIFITHRSSEKVFLHFQFILNKPVVFHVRSHFYNAFIVQKNVKEHVLLIFQIREGLMAMLLLYL